MEETAQTVALVTGGAVRIGAAICRRLASADILVVIHYRTSSSQAEALRQEIVAAGGQALTIQADLHSAESCAELIERTWYKCGRLNYLVNNAGVFRRDAVTDFVIEQALEQVWLNAWAPLILTREFAQRCPTGGAVVNLLDRRIHGLDRTYFSYGISKRLLENFTYICALEYAPSVRINAVAPGAILPPRQPGGEPAPPAGAAPLGLHPSPDDIADAVYFLLTRTCITGQVVFVDGGQHLHGQIF